MIKTGIDLVDVARVKDILNKHENAIERMFGEVEREYILSLKGNGRFRSAAARFAAKEAFGKAFGTGLLREYLHSVQVRNDEHGQPHLLLNGKAAETARGYRISLSLTHTDTAAAAIVTAIEEGGIR